MMAAGHRPVMLEEAAAALAPSGDETVVDATFGGGGHARRLLDGLGPGGRLIAIDRDPEALRRVDELQEDARFTFEPGPYDEVLWRMVEEGVRADAVLFDLGLSSYQIEDPERGFSYTAEGPLDMRMDPDSGASAAELLNSSDEDELVSLLSEYGDVRRGEARRVAREVVGRRPLSTTMDLAEAVRAAVGWSERGGNPSRRVFQAVRMRVNDELGGLERGLMAAERILGEDGRLAVISFHSGEDRLVKRFISDRSGRCTCPPELPVCVCGASPIFRARGLRKPSGREVEMNPRSASARLRAAVRTGEPPLREGDT